MLGLRGMTLLKNRTPVQLLRIIAALNLLIVLGFGILGFPRHFHYGWSLLFIFILTVLGLISNLAVEQELKDGIASERWPDALISSLRKLHPTFSVLGLLLIIAGFVSIIVITISGARIGGVWCLLYPAMTFTRVGSYLRPRPPSSSDSLLKLIETSKPLQSEHWGTPPHSFSN